MANKQKKLNEPTFDIDPDEVIGLANRKLQKDRYWLVLSRLTYNNKLNKHTIIADTMKQAVQDFLRCYGDNEEFLMINEIEFGALSVISSTL